MLFCSLVLAPSVEESIDPVERFKALTLQKVDGLRCTIHAKPPVVEFHGQSLRDIRISVRCCCREMSSRANRAIAQPFSNS